MVCLTETHSRRYSKCLLFGGQGASPWVVLGGGRDAYDTEAAGSLGPVQLIEGTLA